MALFAFQAIPKSGVLRPRVQARYVSIKYLVGSIPVPKSVKAPDVPKPTASQLKKHAVLTPKNLTDEFRASEYGKPTVNDTRKSQSFFHRAVTRHEWLLANYSEIPDVKYARLKGEKQEKLDRIEPYQRTKYHVTLEASKKTFGIQPGLLQPLPEVVFLGHTNVGKLSLINTLLVSKSESSTAGEATEHAFVSRRAGYTKTLSCYNVGNTLRLIDTPGYGQFGETAQGDAVLEYLRERRQLRRAFVLIDSVEGVRDVDQSLLDYLTSEGVPFEVVFTKVDQLVQKKYPKMHWNPSSGAELQSNVAAIKEGNEKVKEYYRRLIETSGLGDLPTLPRLLFNNSDTNRLVKMRHGYKEIRFAIAQSCGIVQ